MPETTFERLVFLVGLCAIGGLAFLVVRGDHHRARSTVPSTVVSTPAPATTASAAITTTTSPEPAAPAQPARLAHLVLAAPGGDCWVVVRSGSARGKVVFAGTIAQGTRKRFAGARLWLRFGAAGNLSGRLNGAEIAIPPGSPTILATAAGIRVLALR